LGRALLSAIVGFVLDAGVNALERDCLYGSLGQTVPTFNECDAIRGVVSDDTVEIKQGRLYHSSILAH